MVPNQSSKKAYKKAKPTTLELPCAKFRRKLLEYNRHCANHLMALYRSHFPFLLRTALEKSVLALSAQRVGYRPQTLPRHTLHLTHPAQDVLKTLSTWDEQIYPYFSPLLTAEELSRGLSSYLGKTNAEILYFDHYLEDKFSPPFLKPLWSPELWLNVDILFAAAYKASFLKEIARQNQDQLMARAILRAKKIEHVSSVGLQTPSFPWQNTDFIQGHRQTVQDYLNLLGAQVSRIDLRANGSLRIHWNPPQAMVSIIIPNRNHLSLLKKCIDSICEITDYPTYEILVVDDHSSDVAVLNYYQQQTAQRKNFRVLQGVAPFNFSRACNQGAAHASGEMLLFLNNDTEVLHPDWLTNLAAVAHLPGVGAVGAKLIYPNGKVQHAGVVIGLEGHATHVFQGVIGDPYTPFGHVDWMRNVSAVTAACMLVRKEAFWEVGGFDEQFQIAFGDIDFCLRLRDAGYRIVYTPDACLIHHEGKSRGKSIPPQDIRTKAEYFLQKVAEGDPYYHPALSRAWRIPTPRWRWEQDPVERLRKIIQFYG